MQGVDVERSIGSRGVNITSLMKPNDLCLVTGDSGYPATWIAKNLLAKAAA